MSPAPPTRLQHRKRYSLCSFHHGPVLFPSAVKAPPAIRSAPFTHSREREFGDAPEFDDDLAVLFESIARM
jgi:hypothetical protein